MVREVVVNTGNRLLKGHDCLAAVPGNRESRHDNNYAHLGPSCWLL
jgi:hypothetical protein